jgi:hypothetical protein
MSGQKEVQLQFPTPLMDPPRPYLIDPWWRKARIAARLILKKEEGKTWSARDRRLASRLADDPGVTNRLIDQAYYSLIAGKRYRPSFVHQRAAIGTRN